MKRLWNSLQFRLFTSFGIIATLVFTFVVVSGQASQLADIRKHQSLVSDTMVKNAYVLMTLFHKYIDFETDSQRTAIKTTIDQLVKDTQAIQNALHNGDPDIEITALNQADVLLLLDKVESNYQQFKSTMTDLVAGNPSDWEPLIETLQTAGITFATYGERLALGIETISTQEEQNSSTLIGVIALIISVMLIIATFVVVQSIRAINGLVGATQAFAEGNFKVRASLRTLNEIALVGSTFNEMADQIDQLLGTLEQQVIIAEQARDNAEQSRARAEQSDQVKSAFLASMSHELRTPLNAIINFSKFVIKGVMGPVTEQQTDALTTVVESGKHLLSLINDVLDISKIESGSLNLFIEPNVDVSEILHQTVEITEALLEGKPVSVQVDIASNLPVINADRQRLRQIITNIISNACKFTDEGFIKIGAYYAHSHIQISVQDTGPGIAAEDSALVFESFKQTSTGLRQGKGTGLGMPISKSLTEALGGKLWFESEIGKGSTFFFTLPVESSVPITAHA